MLSLYISIHQYATSVIHNYLIVNREDPHQAFPYRCSEGINVASGNMYCSRSDVFGSLREQVLFIYN